MSIDPSHFIKDNIIDTCAVWNLLSSPKLYLSAKLYGARFYCTGVVLYECLKKTRKKPTATDQELQQRLIKARSTGDFGACTVTISDLQNDSLLERRKRLDLGELSSIAFAMKTQQVFMTDDQSARKIANQILKPSTTQTTPHLLSCLIYENCLSDYDKNSVVSEHKEMNGILEPHFEDAYKEACRCRLISRSIPESVAS